MSRFFVLLDDCDNIAHAAPTLETAREFMQAGMDPCEPVFPVEVEAVYRDDQAARFDVFDLSVAEPFEPAHALAIPPIGKLRCEGGARLNDSTREEALAECARRNHERLSGTVESVPQWSVVMEIGEPARQYGAAEWELNGLEGVQQLEVVCPIRVVTPTAEEIERYAAVPVEV